MCVTFCTSWLLSAALLFGADTPKKPAGMVCVTYPVADLVVPIGQETGADRDTQAKPAKRPARRPCREGGEAAKTMETSLMDLLRNTIEPNSWSERGGPGTMEYHAVGMGLVVNNSRDVQEQVADLLTALRRLQDVEVAVEIRLLTVSEASFERIGVDFDIHLTTTDTRNAIELTAVRKESDSTCASKLQELAFLNEVQLHQLLEAVQADRRSTILQTPRVTVFNGQRARIDVTDSHSFVTSLKAVRKGDQVVVVPKNEVFITGVRFAVQPAVSADRRSVRLNFHGEVADLESATVPMVPVTTHLAVKVDGEGRKQVVPVQQFVQRPSLWAMKVDKAFQVGDGQTAVMRLGTRLAEARTETVSGPPLLAKIPYLSRLFRNVGYGREAQTLLLLITPRVIVNEEEEQVFLGNLPPLPK